MNPPVRPIPELEKPHKAFQSSNPVILPIVGTMTAASPTGEAGTTLAIGPGFKVIASNLITTSAPEVKRVLEGSE